MEALNRYILILLTSLGALDCLTTALAYPLGIPELNPIMASFLNISVITFVTVKLAMTGSMYWMGSLTKNMISQMKQTETKTKLAKYFWISALYGLTIVMVFVLANNILALTA